MKKLDLIVALLSIGFTASALAQSPCSPGYVFNNQYKRCVTPDGACNEGLKLSADKTICVQANPPITPIPQPIVTASVATPAPTVCSANMPRNIVELAPQCPACYMYMPRAQVEANKPSIIQIIAAKYPAGDPSVQWGSWMIENGTLSLAGAGYGWASDKNPQQMGTSTSLCTLKLVAQAVAVTPIPQPIVTASVATPAPTVCSANMPRNIVELAPQCPACYMYMPRAQVEANKPSIIQIIAAKYPAGDPSVQWGSWMIENGTLSLAGAGYGWASDKNPQQMGTSTSLCTLKLVAQAVAVTPTPQPIVTASVATPAPTVCSANMPRNIVELAPQCPACYMYMPRAQVEANKPSVIQIITAKYPAGDPSVQWGSWMIENGTLSLAGAGYGWASDKNPQQMGTSTSLCTLKLVAQAAAVTPVPVVTTPTPQPAAPTPTARRAAPGLSCYPGYVYNQEKKRCMTPDGKCEQGQKLGPNGQCIL